MNQLVNLAAKYKYMFGGRFEVPMLVRMIVGRSWGQGAQHSQSLQSLFAHVPGLVVIMPSTSESILASYPWLMANHRGPVLSLEHRLLYDVAFRVDEQPDAPRTPAMGSRRLRAGGDVTVVATSIMVLEAMRAAQHLAEVGAADVEVIDLHCVSHPDVELILGSVAKTGRLVVADTSWRAFGVGAELCRLVCERDPVAAQGAGQDARHGARTLPDREVPRGPLLPEPAALDGRHRASGHRPRRPRRAAARGCLDGGRLQALQGPVLTQPRRRRRRCAS